MTPIIAACGVSDWEKMAKLRPSRAHLVRMTLTPVIHSTPFGVLGAYWRINDGKC